MHGGTADAINKEALVAEACCELMLPSIDHPRHTREHGSALQVKHIQRSSEDGRAKPFPELQGLGNEGTLTNCLFL